MINGIFLPVSGGVQQIGEIQTLEYIIRTIKQILPELEAEEKKRLFSTLSTEELAAIIKEREDASKPPVKTGKTEKLK
jgi:hypothetical protein